MKFIFLQINYMKLINLRLVHEITRLPLKNFVSSIARIQALQMIRWQQLKVKLVSQKTIPVSQRLRKVPKNIYFFFLFCIILLRLVVYALSDAYFDRYNIIGIQVNLLFFFFNLQKAMEPQGIHFFMAKDSDDCELQAIVKPLRSMFLSAPLFHEHLCLFTNNFFLVF